MMVEVRASWHPCLWIGNTLQKSNQADTPFMRSHYSRPVVLIASQVLLSGAEAASQAEISCADHRTLPPILIGAGILPQLLRRKICLFDKLNI
jgi:hypothetical protein